LAKFAEKGAFWRILSGEGAVFWPVLAKEAVLIRQLANLMEVF
jgi:hypothetical protein